MLAGKCERLLRSLNPDIRVFCGDDDSKPAGVFMVVRPTDDMPHGDYAEICGIDKNFVPEHTEVDITGKIIKGGWRRVLRILVVKKLIDRCEAERRFQTHDLRIPERIIRPPKRGVLDRMGIKHTGIGPLER